MNVKWYNYKIINKDTNECEYIKTFQNLTEEDLQRLSEILKILKEEHKGDDYDTFDIIYEACEFFEKRCRIRAVMDSCPCEGVIEF